MKTLFNWLPNPFNYEKFHISGRGDVYSGNCPFYVDRRDPNWLKLFTNMPWVISHPDAKDKVFRVIGVESYCTFQIWEGQGIGLLVKEIKGKELDEWWPVAA